MIIAKHNSKYISIIWLHTCNFFLQINKSQAIAQKCVAFLMVVTSKIKGSLLFLIWILPYPATTKEICGLFKWFNSHWTCSIKEDVLKTFAIFTGKNLCWGLFSATFFKNKLHKGVSCGYCKVFMTTYFVKHLRTVASWLFQCSLLQRPKDARFILYDTFRVQDPNHTSSFLVFKSESLFLNRVPSCVRKHFW